MQKKFLKHDVLGIGIKNLSFVQLQTKQSFWTHLQWLFGIRFYYKKEFWRKEPLQSPKALHLELLLLWRLMLLCAFAISSPIFDCLPFVSFHTKLNKLPLLDLICLLPLPNLFLLLFLPNLSLPNLHVHHLHHLPPPHLWSSTT
jgi:hypothetical protein